MATETRTRAKGASRRKRPQAPAVPGGDVLNDTPAEATEPTEFDQPADPGVPFATSDDLPDPEKGKSRTAGPFREVTLLRLQKKVRVHFIESQTVLRLEYLPDVLQVQDLVAKAQNKLQEHIEEAKKAEEEGREYTPPKVDPMEERDALLTNLAYMQVIAHASVMASDAVRGDGHVVYIECRDCDPDKPIRHVKPLWSRAQCKMLGMMECNEISNAAYRVIELEAIRPFSQETEESSSPTPAASSESTP